MLKQKESSVVKKLRYTRVPSAGNVITYRDITKTARGSQYLVKFCKVCAYDISKDAKRHFLTQHP